MGKILILFISLSFSVSLFAKLDPSDIKPKNDPNLEIGKLKDVHGKLVQHVDSGVCTEPDGQCRENAVVQASLAAETPFEKKSASKADSSANGSGSTDK